MKTKLLSLAAAGLIASTAALPVSSAFAHNGGFAAAPKSAGDLRVTLNQLLSEHVLLAASATGAALGGRDAQFKAVANSLDANSVDVSKAIGLVYGKGAEDAFLPLWRKHIGFVVDYTTGLAAKDKTKSDKAVQDLLGYTKDFGAFLGGATGLPVDAVAELTKMHILTLKDVIDAQAAGDPVLAFAKQREAYKHMDMVAKPLAMAIAKQMPDKFPGKADDAATNLRVALNQLMAEHTYVAARATGAALGKRDAEFKAAADSLDMNSVDLSKAIGSVYGADAEKAFLPLWRKHIGFVVDYTVGLATDDKVKSDKAVQDLLGYTQDFGAFLGGATGLPVDAVAGLVKAHILGLKDVVDAQKKGDQQAVYDQLRMAFSHMQTIADPVAGAIVKQFPAKFGAPAAPAALLPVTGGSNHETEMPNTLPMAIAALVGLGLALTAGSAVLAKAKRRN